jgi:DNA-binding NtrC family response regulator
MKNRLLFVDDDPGVLRGLGRMLFQERERWDVHFAQSGPEALEMLSRESCEIVVADMRMPDMDGIHFLTLVQQAHPDAIRMLLTGNTDQGTAIAAINTGNVFRFLSKPCEPETRRANSITGHPAGRCVPFEEQRSLACAGRHSISYAG